MTEIIFKKGHVYKVYKEPCPTRIDNTGPNCPIFPDGCLNKEVILHDNKFYFIEKPGDWCLSLQSGKKYIRPKCRLSRHRNDEE